MANDKSTPATNTVDRRRLLKRAIQFRVDGGQLTEDTAWKFVDEEFNQAGISPTAQERSDLMRQAFPQFEPGLMDVGRALAGELAGGTAKGLMDVAALIPTIAGALGSEAGKESSEEIRSYGQKAKEALESDWQPAENDILGRGVEGIVGFAGETVPFMVGSAIPVVGQTAAMARVSQGAKVLQRARKLQKAGFVDDAAKLMKTVSNTKKVGIGRAAGEFSQAATKKWGEKLLASEASSGRIMQTLGKIAASRGGQKVAFAAGVGGPWGVGLGLQNPETQQALVEQRFGDAAKVMRNELALNIAGGAIIEGMLFPAIAKGYRAFKTPLESLIQRHAQRSMSAKTNFDQVVRNPMNGNPELLADYDRIMMLDDLKKRLDVANMDGDREAALAIREKIAAIQPPNEARTAEVMYQAIRNLHKAYMDKAVGEGSLMDYIEQFHHNDIFAVKDILDAADFMNNARRTMRRSLANVPEAQQRQVWPFLNEVSRFRKNLLDGINRLEPTTVSIAKKLRSGRALTDFEQVRWDTLKKASTFSPAERPIDIPALQVIARLDLDVARNALGGTAELNYASTKRLQKAVAAMNKDLDNELSLRTILQKYFMSPSGVNRDAVWWYLSGTKQDLDALVIPDELHQFVVHSKGKTIKQVETELLDYLEAAITKEAKTVGMNPAEYAVDMMATPATIANTSIAERLMMEYFPGTFTRYPIEPTQKMPGGILDTFAQLNTTAIATNYNIGYDKKTVLSVLNKQITALKKERASLIPTYGAYHTTAQSIDRQLSALQITKVFMEATDTKGKFPAQLVHLATNMVGADGRASRVFGRVQLDPMASDQVNTLMHEIGHTVFHAMPDDFKEAFIKTIDHINQTNPDALRNVMGHARWDYLPEWSRNAAEIFAESFGQLGSDHFYDHMALNLPNIISDMPEDAAKVLMEQIDNIQSFATVHPDMPAEMRELVAAFFPKVKSNLAYRTDPLVRQMKDKMAKIRFEMTDQVARQMHEPTFLEYSFVTNVFPESFFHYGQRTVTAAGGAKRKVPMAKLTKEGAEYFKTTFKEDIPVGTDLEDVTMMVRDRLHVIADEVALAKTLPSQTRDPLIMLDRLLQTKAELDWRLNDNLALVKNEEGQVVNYFKWRMGGDARVKEFESIFERRVPEWMSQMLGEDKDKAKVALDELYQFMTDIEKFKEGIQNLHPTIWDNLDTSVLDTPLRNGLRAIAEQIPAMEPLYKLSARMGPISRMLNTPQYWARKHPHMYPIFSAMRSMPAHIRETQAYLLDNKDDILGLSKGSKTLQELAQLHHTANRIRGTFSRFGKEAKTIMNAARDMMWEGNRYANLRVDNDTLLNDHLIWRNEKGVVAKDRMVDTLVNEYGYDAGVAEAAYGYYKGAVETLHWVNEQRLRFLAQKRAATTNEIRQQQMESSKLLGYMPQSQRGKYVVQAYRKNKKGKSVLAHIYFTDKWDDAKQALAKLKKEGTYIDTPEGYQHISPGELRIKNIARAKERATDMYFGASPTHMKNFLEEALEKANLDDPTYVDKIKDQLGKLIGQEMKAGQLLRHSRHRENVTGFEKDNLFNAIFDYVSAWSSYTARTDALEQSLKSMRYVKNDPRLYKEANKLIRDMTMGASEEAKWSLRIRRTGFMVQLAGNLATAIIQLTQNPVMGVPRMAMDGIPRSGRQLSRAMWDIVHEDIKRMKFTKSFRTAMKGGKTDGYKSGLGDLELKALEQGYLSGQTYSNYADAMLGQMRQNGGGLSEQLLNASSLPLRYMESLNRRSTLLAAFRYHNKRLLKQGMDADRAYREALSRASTIVDDAHVIYEKANLPSWARGEGIAPLAGRTFYIFKQYTHGYFQMLEYLAKNGGPGEKAAVQSFAMLATLGGMKAVPGWDVADKLVSMIAGKSTEELLAETAGYEQSMGIIQGPLSAILPTHLGDRLNPTPWNGKDAVFFATYDDIVKTADQFKRGDYWGMAENFPLAPKFVKNLAKGLEQYKHGYRTRGGKLISVDGFEPVKSDFGDMITQFAGFSPAHRDLTEFFWRRAEEKKWREKKALYGVRLRNKIINKESVDDKDWNEFWGLKNKAMGAGYPWSAKSPYDLIKKIYTDGI